MTISIIACISSNAGLGNADDELLFHIKEDLKRFQDMTKGQIVVQGRKTFDSIVQLRGEPLGNRTNVVLTRNIEYVPQHGEQVFHNIETIINHHKTFTDRDKSVFVIGGEETYRLLLPHAGFIYLTIVNKHVEEATAYYPIQLQDELGFVEVESEEHYSEKYEAYYKFVKYQKHTIEDNNKEGDENE